MKKENQQNTKAKRKIRKLIDSLTKNRSTSDTLLNYYNFENCVPIPTEHNSNKVQA